MTEDHREGGMPGLHCSSVLCTQPGEVGKKQVEGSGNALRNPGVTRSPEIGRAHV